MILYNGSVWHGHRSNTTRKSRRSVQGAFIRRKAPPSMDWSSRMRPETLERLGPLAKFLLAI
jgi:ectoine hydroxylase-related dioxygenase (phytanoyl-CoA dioxygenase family)